MIAMSNVHQERISLALPLETNELTSLISATMFRKLIWRNKKIQ